MCCSIVESIFRRGLIEPDKIALIEGERSASYGQLVNNIVIIYHKLIKNNIKKGDRLLLVAIPCLEYVSLYFAVHLCGAIAVPVVKNATEEQKKIYSSIVDAVMIVDDYSNYIFDEKCKKTDCSIRMPEKDDLADIIFTTGTTGKPKGVMLTHGNMLAGACNVINGGKIQKNDINLLPVPLHHAYGLTTMRAILYEGSTIVLQDGFSSLKTTYNNIVNYNCDRAYLIPSIISIFYEQTKHDLTLLLGNLNKIEFCTAPLNKKMRELLLSQLPDTDIYNSYGATEAARTLYLKIADNKQGLNSLGRTVENVQVKIVDEADISKELSFGEVGRVAVCGEVVAKGYYKMDSLTEQFFSDKIFYTSDMGYIDEKGYVYLMGREDDILNVGGEKVFPEEIEAVAMQSGLVEDCACVRFEDPVLGDIPILFVVALDKINIDLLMQYISRHIEKYKIPRRIINIEKLPQNYIGKVDRRQLFEMAEKEML